MNKFFGAEFYNYLIEAMGACIHKTEWKEFRKIKKIVVLGTNMITKFETLIQHLQEENSALVIIIIAQIQMLDKMPAFIHDKCMCIEWEGRYSTDIIKELKKATDIKNIDSFLYFSTQANDFRDLNYWQIAESLANYHKIDIFTIDNSESIYKIEDITKYTATMELYQAADKFLEVIGRVE